MDKNNNKISRVVIAGGGTAGWIAAAALSKKLGELLDITLVESEAIGTVGVGEASIPPMRVFHRLLGIEERAFMRATGATFKLGIAFENWGREGDRYIHAFGRIGQGSWLCEFHHFWLRARALGMDFALGDFCSELQAAEAGKFATAEKSEINYAYHLDAGAYAKFLRNFSQRLGVRRIEGKIIRVGRNADSGFIEALQLDNGRRIEGDLFIDCTGFRGLLIEEALGTGYEDWSHWLLSDSAIPVQTRVTGPVPPYTRATARGAGWQWRIPLQYRVGNGLVYCSDYLSDDEAAAQLLANIEGEVLTEPKVIRFKTGRRRRAWNKNCIALGLASGFVEPLESTSIHLIITGITRLMQLFPFDGIADATVNHYNALTRMELESIRDFIVLHYHLNERESSAFWRRCRDMEIPQSLAQRIRLFRDNAYAYQGDGELFRVDSWVQVMLGQGLKPQGYHPLTRLMPEAQLAQLLGGLKASIARGVAPLPAHQDFVEGYCAVELAEAVPG
ncbi:tryptophan halogenase family protein [Microbulbifer thermotolerans]|uniref:tryptophan halogenase family protein n=1 Tax=Microbulbifer thermotolerans TaxID=252514 RepID=UPI0022495011|nr:tryptophan halogenase family protein [Microbulbifer thermotolerans]MCX2778122.1 tryptophan 7-halogenase [Microbulbifer thermotolerans]MCX2806208.1 tryptophan 7-halogenase [Microbulbifer thermotolerans]MCX2832226.1 tryptophan 7-halogenase [Microbulbifer thermotolerans]